MADIQLKIVTLFDTKSGQSTLQQQLSEIQKNNKLKLSFDDSDFKTIIKTFSDSLGNTNKKVTETVTGLGSMTKEVSALNKETNQWVTNTAKVENDNKLIAQQLREQAQLRNAINQISKEDITTKRNEVQLERLNIQAEKNRLLAEKQRQQQSSTDTNKTSVTPEETKHYEMLKKISQEESKYWDMKRQATLNAMTTSNGQIQNMKEYYTQLEKTSKAEFELAEAKKKNSQFSKEKVVGEYWDNLNKYIENYKKGLISAQEAQKKLNEIMFKDGTTKSVWQFNGGSDKQQSDAYKSLKSTNSVIDKQSITQYNELLKLTKEEYDLKMKQVNVDKENNKALEDHLSTQLKINASSQEKVKNNIDTNGLANAERELQLKTEMLKLEGELAVKEQTRANNEKLQIDRSEYQLEMFKRGMNVNLDTTGKRFDYVAGAKDKLEEYRNTLKNVISENGKWYKVVDDGNGSLKKEEVTAQKLRMEYRELRGEITNNIGLFDRMRSNLKKFSEYLFAGSFIMQGIQQFKNMTSYISEMDKYMTNARMITGQTAQQVRQLSQEYLNLGKSLGATTTDVAQIGEEFLRQGKNSKDTMELVKDATMMAQLAGTGTTESAEYLTAISNAYKLNVGDVQDVVSKLVAVDSVAATSVDELAQALQRTSNSASTVGISMNTLIGYLGTISEVTRQSGDTVGKRICRYA